MVLPNDDELLLLFSKISAGDEKAFTHIFQRYYDIVFSTALRYCKKRQLAEDVVQQVFLEIWRKRATLTELKNGAAWIRIVTRNQAISILKRESIRDSYIEYVKELFQSEQDTPLLQLEHRQNLNLIEKLIAGLPSRQQQVFRMSRYEGATYAQIGAALGISTETVKDHVAKALKTLRRSLTIYKKDLLMLLAILFFYFFY